MIQHSKVLILYSLEKDSKKKTVEYNLLLMISEQEQYQPLEIAKKK